MKKLIKIKLHDAAVLNDREMKMVVGGSGTGTDGSGTGEEKVCIYIQCGCTHGMSFTSGTPDLGGTWKKDCSYDMTTSSGAFKGHCINDEGYCYRVYKTV
jgi:natural product precursor